VIFNTWTFGLFGLTTVLVYWAVVPPRFRAAYLVGAGLIFYAWSVPAYLLLILALTAVTFGIGRAMLVPGRTRQERRVLLTLGVLAITAVLGYFKYSRFLAISVNQVAARHILPIPHIVVPLAISFFTFEFVHVLVDIYLGKITSLNLREFMVFTFFFPTLVAGPIKRFQSFAPQVSEIQTPAKSVAALNVYRIAIGLTKKMLIADSMTVFIQPLREPGAPFGAPDYWIAVLAYSAKIYFDFTGYSDIAIGVAGLLGLRIPENFNRPYWAQNISHFWRRWHMSLSSWIRDYIFIPLGGSRGGAIITAVNLFIAMALAGLWHGAGWNFVLWGLWHGAGLAIHRAWSLSVVPSVALFRQDSWLLRGSSTLVTFAFVSIGWVLFATASLQGAGQVFTGLFAR
jgi:alginate O-acetyltransferase complex protein AlgI